MSTYDRVAALPVVVEDYDLQLVRQEVSSDFERITTVVTLRGGGHEGKGEDVVYDPEDHVRQARYGPRLPLAMRGTLDDLSRRIGDLDLFPTQPPAFEVYRNYRRWAFESAALDLALRQGGARLDEVLGRSAAPVTFVVSLRLGEPPSLAPIERRRAVVPSLRFKLDATSSWTDELLADLAASGVVDTIDFKGAYVGTAVDQPPDPNLYARVVAALPDCWIEDPALTDATRPVLAPHMGRVTWDAPIHSIADIAGLATRPRMVNVKPSRFGSLRSLLDCYDWCAGRGIRTYGGGQFELGVGRGQIQYLASLFHPEAPNDTAPGAYNLPDPPSTLPASPLAATPAAVGFRWGAAGM